MLWQAFQTLVPVDAAGSGPRVLDRVRPPAAVLDDPARRLGRADRRARALHRGPRRHGPVRPARRAARARGRALRRRRDRGRRALHGARGRRLDDPRQAPARDGAAPRPGTRTSATASRRSTSASPAMAVYMATTRPPVFETPDGPRAAVSAGPAGWPQDVIELRPRAARRPPTSRTCPGCWSRRRRSSIPPRARGPPHGQAAQPADVGLPEGVASWDEHKEPIPAPARARAPLRPGVRRRRNPRRRREGPEDIEAQPAHDPRHVPRRRPQLRAERRAAAGAGLGGAPDADPRPLPDRRHDDMGGSITGAPGRNAAMVLLRTSATTRRRWWRGAGRARAGSH